MAAVPAGVGSEAYTSGCQAQPGTARKSPAQFALVRTNLQPADA
ncbi:hypothetical protein [Paenibacillus sp. y28]